MPARVPQIPAAPVQGFAKGGIALTLLTIAAFPLAAQSIENIDLKLRCESPMQYPDVPFDSDVRSACSEIREKADQVIEKAKAAPPIANSDPWRPSWLQSPKCKEEEFRAVEDSAVDLTNAVRKVMRRGEEVSKGARQLSRTAQEMKSLHNAERALALTLEAHVYLDMWEDTFALIPTIYVAYADRALAAKCYQQADKAYRFVVERYTDDSVRVLREKAKLGVDDVRAKLK